MTPEGWRVAELRELLESVTTGVSVNSESRPRGDGETGVLKTSAVTYGVFRPTENKAVLPEDLHRARERPKAGSVLLSRMNTLALVGASAYVDRDWPDLVLPDRIWQLQPRRTSADGRWLFHFLSAPATRGILSELSSGTSGSMKNLSQERFLGMSLPVPPLPEQRKIAAILSSVEDAIEATQAVIDQLQVVKKAMMAELLTRGLPGRHTKFKMTEIGEVPEEWDVSPCGDLFEVQLGKMMSVEARAGANQLPYLRNENVYWHRLDLSDVATMHFDDREVGKFRLRPGDLLACEGRHIGRCALWNGELDECYYQKALHRLRSKDGRVTSAYMQHFMMLRFRFMTDLVAEANTTSTIPHLPREKLLILPVWYPPREEQDEIVEALGAEAGREQSEVLYLAELQGVKAALMSVLLTGEVRVKPGEDAA